MIALVELKDGADLEALVAAGERMIAADPQIRSGELAVGRTLMDGSVHQASLSLVLDFDDEEGWRRYVAGPHHSEYDAMGMPWAARVTATQYVRGD